jgi:hypothetical protein
LGIGVGNTAKGANGMEAQKITREEIEQTQILCLGYDDLTGERYA